MPNKPGIELLEPRLLLSGSIGAQFTEIDNSSALSGYNTYDLEIDVNYKWMQALMIVDLAQGSIYQDAQGSDTQPAIADITNTPSLEFDTYLTGPSGEAAIIYTEGTRLGHNSDYIYRTHIDTDRLEVWWTTADPEGIDPEGFFDIARITLSDDAIGTWSLVTDTFACKKLTVSGQIEDGAFDLQAIPAPQPPIPLGMRLEEVDNSAVLNGYKTYDIFVDTDSLRYSTGLTIDLTHGHFYQSIDNFLVTEAPDGAINPGDEFDTFLFAPYDLDTYYGIRHTPRYQLLQNPVLDSVSINVKTQAKSAIKDEQGSYWFGRITLSDDATGQWHWTSANVGFEVLDEAGIISQGAFLNDDAAPAADPIDGDFNGDGQLDIMWWNEQTQTYQIWQMDGTLIEQVNAPNASASAQRWIEALGDFTRDGLTDLVYRENGAVYIRRMTSAVSAYEPLEVGALYLKSQLKVAELSDDWTIAGVGDFTGDGQNDILLRHKESGANRVWEMNGFEHQDTLRIKRVRNMQWQIAGVGDFNGDGQDDILWRNQRDGRNTIWEMDGTAIQSTTALRPARDLDWQIAAVGDYTGDGKTDILWRNTREGKNALWEMNGMAFRGRIDLPDQNDEDWQIAGSLLGM